MELKAEAVTSKSILRSKLVQRALHTSLHAPVPLSLPRLIGGIAIIGGNQNSLAAELERVAIIEKLEGGFVGWLRGQPGVHPPLDAAILEKQTIADLATRPGIAVTRRFLRS